jgi:apolipoprotein N-acyltransferase
MTIPSWALFFLGGLLFGLCFVFPFLYWCFIPAFVLFLFGVKKESSVRKLFLYGLLSGTLHYAGSFYWVWSTFPILWMADAPYALQLGAIGLYWILTSVAMGVTSGFFAVWVKKFLSQPYLLLLLGPVLWVIGEVIRSFLFSLYAFGPGGFFNVGFSYGYLGYLLAETPRLSMLASVAGVYGLSYLAALISLTCYVVFFGREMRKFGICVLMLLAVLTFLLPFFFTQPYEAKGIKVVTVETYFDHAFFQKEGSGKEKKEELKKAVELAFSSAPDVILLPEDARLSDSFSSASELFIWAHEHASSREIVIIDGGPAVDARGRDVLRSYMYDLRTDSVYFFDKRYLVPQGEFISYVHQGILFLIVGKEKLQTILAEARFEPGVMNDAAVYPQHLPGILFCFETMVPYGVKRAEHWRSPEFIAHPISHAWFIDPFSLEYQLYSMLKVSAIWNHVPIVSAGSMTESMLFLPSGGREEGQIVHETPLWKLREFNF